LKRTFPQITLIYADQSQDICENLPICGENIKKSQNKTRGGTIS
jgi:hypothetical protein